MLGIDDPNYVPPTMEAGAPGTTGAPPESR